jgi:hypothetical protein
MRQVETILAGIQYSIYNNNKSQITIFEYFVQPANIQIVVVALIWLLLLLYIEYWIPVWFQQKNLKDTI